MFGEFGVFGRGGGAVGVVDAVGGWVFFFEGESYAGAPGATGVACI